MNYKGEVDSGVRSNKWIANTSGHQDQTFDQSWESLLKKVISKYFFFHS